MISYLESYRGEKGRILKSELKEKGGSGVGGGGSSLLASCGNTFARPPYQLIRGSADQPNLEEGPTLLNNKLDEGG